MSVLTRRRGRRRSVLPAAALGAALLGAAATISDAAPTAPGDAGAPSALVGELLVAAPEMSDPRFYHAVILIVQHDRNGAFGLVVNKPVEKAPIARLLADMGQKTDGIDGTIEVFAGGPVEPELGFVLHSAEYRRPETLAIDKDVALTSSPGVLRDIAQQRGPKKYLFAFGYAGWGPGQLEGELKEHAWFTAPADPKLLFDDDRGRLWQDALDLRERAL